MKFAQRLPPFHLPPSPISPLFPFAMTIHVLAPLPQSRLDQAEGTPAQQQEADTSTSSTAYDSVWAGEEGVGTTVQPPPGEGSDALERAMLSQDKLYVVLAVVLLIWLGVAFLLFRTDRRLTRLERRLDDTK